MINFVLGSAGNRCLGWKACCSANGVHELLHDVCSTTMYVQRGHFLAGGEKLFTPYPSTSETMYPVLSKPGTLQSRNHVLCTPSSKLCTQYLRYHVLRSVINLTKKWNYPNNV